MQLADLRLGSQLVCTGDAKQQNPGTVQTMEKHILQPETNEKQSLTSGQKWVRPKMEPSLG